MPGFPGKREARDIGRGGSILITSAPRSSNVRAQSGPARTQEKSTTRKPARGPLMISVLRIWQGRDRSRGRMPVRACRSSDAQIGFWISAIASSAASTPWLTAIWPSFLVAACATVGPCANSSAMEKVAFSSMSSGDDQVDQAPRSKRRRIIAAAEHGHFLGRAWRRHAGPGAGYHPAGDAVRAPTSTEPIFAELAATM